jgi:hypothetical protein
MGMPFSIGYCSAVATLFNALLMFAAVTSSRELFCQYADKNVCAIP